MRISKYPIFLILLFGFTTGTVWAASTFDLTPGNNIDTSPVIIEDGNLTVKQGNIIATRTNTGDTGIAIKNWGNANVFTFHDLDDDQIYRLKLTGDGQTVQFLDKTDNNRLDIVIKTATGNIGIGEATPDERLDINGNLKLTGTDRKIITDGDLCLGSGCDE